MLLSVTNGPFSDERWRLAQQSIRLFAAEVIPRFNNPLPVASAV